jgi:pilus assembly protein CpaC
MGMGMLGNLTSVGSFPITTTSMSPTVNALFRFVGGGATWTMFIDALKEDGLLKILAEPTLITLSGKNASFLAGGEFPYPIPQSIGAGSTTISIEFKTFGVGLNFTPTVLSNGKISMEVAPEVSELDFSNAVTFQGFVIPALTTRRVSTVVELADGQSILSSVTSPSSVPFSGVNLSRKMKQSWSLLLPLIW